ncbi:MAG: cupredoxin domain-containing protein [Halobacteriota archaeon]
MKKYLLVMAVIFVAAPLLVAGCTSTSNPSPSPSTATVSATAAAATSNASTSGATSSPSTSGATSSPSPNAIAASQTVVIQGFSFQPASITIQTGGSVIWRNDDSVSHQIVSNTNAFSSPVLSPGGSYTHVFDQAGTYPYHCGIHPYMMGTITVQ